MMNHFTIAGLLVLLTNFSISLIVYFKNRKNITNKIFALFFMAVAVYGYGYYLQSTAPTALYEIYAIKILLFGTIFIATFFVHGVYHVCETYIKKSMIYGIYVVSIIFMFLNFFTDLFARNPIPKFGLKFLFQAGPLYPFLMVYFGICAFIALKSLYEGYHHSKGLKRNQLMYLYWGMSIGFCGGSFGFMLGYSIDLYPLNPFATYTVVIGNLVLGYAIIKYRLLDIRIAISRTVTFLLVYVPILSIPFFIGHILNKNLQITWILPIFFGIILAPSGLYVYLKIQKQIERRLKAKKLEYLKSMEDFLDEVKHIRGLNDLVDLVIAETKRIMGVEKAWVYLVNSKWTEQITKLENKFEKEIPETLISHLRDVGVPIVREELQNKTRITDVSAYKEMRELGISVLVPAMHHGELVCAIVLGGASGSKGESYDGEDIRAFNALGTNVALALKNAMYLEELNAAQADLIASERFAAIGRLAQSAKHEINNPINVISGKIQNLLMDIRGKEDNFKDVRTRLKPMVEDARKLMGELKRAGTLFAGEGEIEKTMEIFERAFKSLEERGGEEKSFKEKLEVHAKEIEVVQSFLLSAEEKTKDENEKELIRELDLTLNTIQINLRKIKDWDKILRDGLNMSYDHVKRITKVVEAIYHLPKETTGDIGPVVVREIIDESFEFTKYQTYWENLSETTSEIKIPENLPKIKAAGSRLVSVMSNIITNAYQAMTQAGITSAGERVLKIRANVAEDDKKYVEIGISNRGQELDKKVLNRMFDRGFSSKGDGRGLGLYICKIQIEQFNEGKIYCQNVKDFGPEFVIRLPVYGD